LSNLANSISGFYKEGERDGMHSRTRESEVARRIPGFRDKRGARPQKQTTETAWDASLPKSRRSNSSDSMMSLYSAG